MDADDNSCSTRSSFSGLCLSVRKAVKETNATLQRGLDSLSGSESAGDADTDDATDASIKGGLFLHPSRAEMTYLDDDCCRASFRKTVVGGKKREGVCSKLLTKCKQHTSRRLRGEFWPPGFFHPLINKKGPTTDGDAIKGSVSLDMMKQFDRLRDWALINATDRLSGSFEGVGIAYDNVHESDGDGTDTDTSNGDVPVARNVRNDEEHSL